MLPINLKQSGLDWSSYPEFIGCSAAMLAVLSQARQLARSFDNVLIQGETGTGKKLLARFCHWHSPRRSSPMLMIPCFGLSEAQLHDELFGLRRPVLDNSTIYRQGSFVEAMGSTLVLEEVGALPLAVQERLLQELSTASADDQHSTSAPLLIATNSVPLMNLVQAGRFLPELAHRLQFNSLSIPPLRERQDDILPLAEHFLRTSRRGPMPTFSMEFVAGLEQYEWPGNVNELASAMRRIAYLSVENTLTAGHLDIALPPHRAGLSLREAERRLIESALVATAGNRTKTAEILGVSVRTVRNKIREYGFPRRH